MLLCERTMVEAGSKKLSLIGLIDTISVPVFPTRTREMKLFLHLVDGIGDYDLTVEFNELFEDRVVVKSKVANLSFPERLAPRRLIYSIPGLPIPHPGRYDVIVFANGREIERQQITVALASTGETS